MKIETRLILEFTIAEPIEYVGQKLELFAHINPEWKTPPKSSKLYWLINVACGGLGRRQRVTKAVSLGKMFRIALRQTGKPPAIYTVADTIIERITG